MTIPHHALVTSKEWAKARLAAGSEPPWTYYRLMQLIDAIDALTAGAEAVSVTHEEGNLYRIGWRDDPPTMPT